MIKKIGLHLKRHWLPTLFAYSAKMLIRGLLKTCKVRVHGLDRFIKIAEKSPCILILWHNRLVIAPEIIYAYASQFTYTAFVSKSHDGDALAALAESYTYGRALRVPHNARHLALSRMIANLQNKGEIMVVTPDGPRGPRGVVKPGVVLAARQTGAKIFPFSWQTKNFWQFNTWDKMMLPKPFTTIDVVFGAPVVLDQEQEGADGYENEAELLKNALNNAQ